MDTLSGTAVKQDSLAELARHWKRGCQQDVRLTRWLTLRLSPSAAEEE